MYLLNRKRERELPPFTSRNLDEGGGGGEIGEFSRNVIRTRDANRSLMMINERRITYTCGERGCVTPLRN